MLLHLGSAPIRQLVHHLTPEPLVFEADLQLPADVGGVHALLHHADAKVDFKTKFGTAPDSRKRVEVKD